MQNQMLRSVTTTRRTRRLVVAAVLALTLGAAACAAPPSGGGGGTPPACGTGSNATASAPNGATITIAPATNLCRSSATVTVSGTGFNATSNNAFGIYVVYGPFDPTTYFSDALVYGAAKWVHTGAPNSSGQAPMNLNGSFSTTLTFPAQYTDGHGNSVDCTTTQCRIVTFAAHGVPDRTQDSSAVISFA
jgi:hypothetical protein